MRIKITGYLDNITENTHIKIESKAIKNKNKIIFQEQDIKNTIIIQKEKIILIRENSEFQNILTFELNKSNISTYLLKKEEIPIELNIITTNLNIEENRINILYQVEESNCEYEYNIEMSEE